MPIIQIADPTDARLTDYLSLTDLKLRNSLESATGLYMAESATVIRRALAAGHQPRSMLLTERWLGQVESLVEEFNLDLPIYLGTDEIITPITGFHLHRGILAAMHRPILPGVASIIANAKRLAILEDLVDHTNVGAIFRAAAALGIDAVLVTPRCADPLYRRSVRVSMGTVFQVPWTRLATWPAGLRELQDEGFVIAALTLAENAISIDALAAANPQRLALLFGTEGHGLQPRTTAIADLSVTIPMEGGVDSLNVAAASAVAFFATRPAKP